MTKPSDDRATTVSKPDADEASAEFDTTDTVAAKGDTPSPGKGGRGETAGARTAGPVDLDSAHQRAS